ncbi:MAG: type IV pilus biogenesis/stability protein PilW, partial [Pseudomonadota bacterium]
MRRRVWFAAGLLLIAGCSSTTTTTTSNVGYQPASALTKPQEELRDRARLHTELAAGYYELGKMKIALDEVGDALRSDPQYAPAYNVAGL